MRPVRIGIIIIAAAIAMLLPASCADSHDDDSGPIRHPDVPAVSDPWSCHDFDAEAADRTTRLTAPGLSLLYTHGVLVERRATAIAFTDLTSGRRAVLDFSADAFSLTIDGQPVPLAACRVHNRTDRSVTVLAVTADNMPVVAIVDDL